MATEIFNDTVQIPVGQVLLAGDLYVPEEALGLVVFSHGSGSSRLSSRNRFVAKYLQDEGFATLLFDLLTPEEDRNYETRFDIARLTNRLTGATEWALNTPALQGLPVGLFGASTGAASALRAAVGLPEAVRAVVLRGGRPDLAAEVLPAVQAPTLLIVGSKDEQVVRYNQQSLDTLQSIKDLQLVEGATHLFEEPGTLEQVAEMATDWFRRYLGKRKQHPLRQDQP